MTLQKTYQIVQNRQNALIVLLILLLVSATIAIDFFFARFHNSSFYLSESLLFSSYWLLFMPLLYIERKLVEWKLVKSTRKILFGLVFVVLTTAIHLLCYPALVWLLSKNFYYHTFYFKQTFDYGLTAYLIKTLLIYGLSLPMMISTLPLSIYKSKPFNQVSSIEESIVEENIIKQSFISSVLVSESNNKKTIILTKDILFFSANPPYVNIHHPSKKYLYTQTLKALESQLDVRQFIRIHKSCIVNIFMVVSYQSRLNGDYDLTLTDNTLLRVSRNYAAVFKAKFEECHRLTTK